MGGFRDAICEDDDALSEPSDSSSQEDTAHKTPFPAELKAAKTRLAKARRSGDEVLEAAALLALGELKFRSGKNARAMQRAQAAMGFFPQAAAKAESARLVVKVHLAEQEQVEALKFAGENMQLFRRARDAKAAAILMLAMVDICMSLERPEQALREATAARDEFKRLKDEAWEAAAGQAVSKVYLRLGKSKHALQAADEALKLYKRVEDVEEEAASLLLISQCHLERREYEDARLFAKVSAERSRPRGAVSSEAAALCQMANITLAEQGEPESAGTFAKTALVKCRKNGDVLGEIAAHQAVASAYQADALPNMALEALNEALALARRIGNRRLISSLLDAIVKIYDPEGALDVMREEEELARRSGDARRELAAMRRVALQQVELERQAEALQVAEEAVDLSRMTKDTRGEADAMKLLGEVNMKFSRFDEACDALHFAKSLLKDAGDIRGQAEVLEMLARHHEDQQQDTKAGQFASERVKVFQEAGWRAEEADAMLRKAKLYKRIRGVTGAVDMARQAVALFEGDEHDAGKEAKALYTLELAKLQAADERSRSDAKRSIVAAQELYREVDDAVGESRAWRELGDFHHKDSDKKRLGKYQQFLGKCEQGPFDEAVKAWRQASEICRKSGNKREEAEAMWHLASMHMCEIQKFEDMKQPDPNMVQAVVQAAIDATRESAQLFRALGCVEQLAGALWQLSGLYVDDDDGGSALEAAEEALQLGVNRRDPHLESVALLLAARAHLSLNEGELAGQSARGARELFEQLGNEGGIDSATQVVELAKHAPKEPKERKRRTAHACPGPCAVLQEEAVSPASRAGGRSREGRFSSMMESLQKQQRREELLTQPRAKCVPSQEQRKLDSLKSNFAPATGARAAAQTAAGCPERQEQGELQEPTLLDLLQQVRPDWNDKEVKQVQDKMAKIGIRSLQALASPPTSRRGARLLRPPWARSRY